MRQAHDGTRSRAGFSSNDAALTNNTMESVMINGVEYTPVANAVQIDGMVYSMVRTRSAGVFAGYIKSRSGMECELVKARRIYYWKGAATLSQLAQSGTSNPKECRFPEEVSSAILTEVIEIIPITGAAKASIDSVPVWKS